MNERHLAARIQQCLALSELSHCPRRKFGAMIIDPVTTSVVSDGYNGGPRKGTKLCGGYAHCKRDGVAPHQITHRVDYHGRGEASVDFYVRGQLTYSEDLVGFEGEIEEKVERVSKKLIHPVIESGRELQIGCYHAEANAITNAAAMGAATAGKWIIVTGEPCLACAKLIHHAGIQKVICVRGGYVGAGDGITHLETVGVPVSYVKSPQDPRGSSTTSDGFSAKGG